MKPLIEFTIPGSPGQGGVNNRYFNVPGHGRKKTTKAKNFDKKFLAIVAPLITKACSMVPLCNVVVRGYWPTRKQTGIDDLPKGYVLAVGDADSPIKAILDNLKTVGVYVDDVRCLDARGSKHYDKHNPRIEVEVWPVEVRP